MPENFIEAWLFSFSLTINPSVYNRGHFVTAPTFRRTSVLRKSLYISLSELVVILMNIAPLQIRTTEQLLLIFCQKSTSKKFIFAF